MQSEQEVVQLHLDDIIPNRFQPREVFDERALKELAASIKEHGVIQPIIVRQVNNKYEIIAGERRYKASALAGMTKIPAIINNLDDKEAAKVALLENLQRKNLNPIEEARTYQKILELDQMTQEQLAKTMGKSQSAVANKLRLLALPDDIQRALLKEEISERHARTLLNLKNADDQRNMLKRVISERMSVRKLEEEIKLINDNMQGAVLMPNMNDQLNNNFSNVSNQPVNSFINQQQSVSPLSNSIPQKQDINMNQQTSFAEPNPITNKPVLMDFIKNDDIVNYGEIDEDEIQNEGISLEPTENDLPTASTPIDLNEIKSSSQDINKIFASQQKEQSQPNEKQKISNDLDSLLNIAPPPQQNSGFSAVQAVKQSEEDNINKDDYFQAPELMKVQLPNTNNNASAVVKDFKDLPNDDLDNSPQSNSNNSISFFQNQEPKKISEQKPQKSLGMALIEETYNVAPKEKEKALNIQQMVQKIRETIQLLERNGAKIDTDEIDFETQYQIVIRIDKNN